MTAPRLIGTSAPTGATTMERTARRGGRAAAEARSAAYAFFSRLVGSPARASSDDAALPPADLGETAALLAEHLPYELDLAPLVEAVERLGIEATGAAAERLSRAHAGLFEVGSDGPPVPLREELAADRPVRAKEEVVRYYAHFGYELSEESRWAPDHLAIELEFLHFLAFREAVAPQEGDAWLSYRLAEIDFLARHPLDWVGQVRAGVDAHAAEPYHRVLLAVIERFLELDHRWSSDTVEMVEVEAVEDERVEDTRPEGES